MLRYRKSWNNWSLYWCMCYLLYNLNAGVELIKSGKSELVIVGASEAILGPPAYIGFSAMGAMATDERMKNLQELLGEGENLNIKTCRHLEIIWEWFVENQQALQS